jgi:hypothetical protein
VFVLLGLGFRFWGFGFRVWGLGFRVYGLGFRVLQTFSASRRSMAVQVDRSWPIAWKRLVSPTLAHLSSEKLVSKFAFNFNFHLYRYASAFVKSTTPTGRTR